MFGQPAAQPQGAPPQKNLLHQIDGGMTPANDLEEGEPLAEAENPLLQAMKAFMEMEMGMRKSMPPELAGVNMSQVPSPQLMGNTQRAPGY